MIVDELIKLQQTKASIKQALIDKGQNPTDEFASYADDISNITSGGGVSFPEGTKFAYSTFTGLTPEMKSYVENCSDCSQMFRFSSLTGDLSLNLKATDISLMFYNAANSSVSGYPIVAENKLTSVSLNLLNEATAVALFNYCTGLKNVTINGSVNNCANMFNNCEMPSVSGEFDTSNCENFSYMFAYCTHLKTVPNIDTSSGKNFNSMFRSCYQLNTIPELDLSSGEDFSYMFDNCTKLTTIPELDVSKGTIFSYMFNYCSALEVLPKLATTSGKVFDNMVNNCGKLVKITELNAASVTTIELSLMSSYASNNTTRYMLIKDIGTPSTCTAVRFNSFYNYGIEDTNIPLSAGARQSLIDTLITYSYDRATAGYSACTLRLSTNTKALLTEDEIAQITAKGYTIA